MATSAPHANAVARSVGDRYRWERIWDAYIRYGASFTLPLLIVVAWQIIATTQILPQGVIPTPLATLKDFWTWVFAPRGSLYSGNWIDTVTVSGLRVLLGFATASILGVITGALMARSRLFSALLDPVFNGIRPIPIPAWIPFTLIFFGINLFASVALVFMAAFPPVVINTLTGMRRVDPLLLRAAQMLGASRARILLRVILPASLPSIFAGLRLAIGMGWLAVVVSELVGVQSGIGYTLYESYYFGRISIVISDMVTVGVLGYLSDRLLQLAATRFVKW